MLNQANNFSNNLYLGQLTKVSPEGCIAHIPNSSLLRPFWQRGNEYIGGMVGQYVVIEGQSHGFLAMIQELELPSKDIRILEQEDTKESKDTTYHPNARLEILLSFDFFSMDVQKGLGRFPVVGGRVYLCQKSLLEMLLRKASSYGKRNSASHFFEDTAVLQADNDIPVFISPQGLFERHCAVLGTTGGGKSYTVTKLIEGILAKSGNQKAVLIDATGEYSCFANSKNVSHVTFGKAPKYSEQVSFSYRNLKVEDLVLLFRPSGQVQKPKLFEAIKSLKIVENCLKIDATNFLALPTDVQTGITNLGISPARPHLIKSEKIRANVVSLENYFLGEINADNNNYDITKLGKQIGYECVTDFGNAAFGKYNETTANHVASLVSRVNQLVTDSYFNSVFNFSGEPAKDLSEVISEFLSGDNKLLVISLENIVSDNSLREILVNSIGRHFLYQAREGGFKDKPILLFLDEAHLFLRKSIQDEYFNEVKLDAFEKIAKECRKHGVYLCLSTQMPRDIPDGVLSQIGSFIVHRLINGSDIEKVRYACPEASRGILSHLPSLGQGEAIFLSVSMPMPIILKMHLPTRSPNSDSPQLFSD